MKALGNILLLTALVVAGSCSMKESVMPPAYVNEIEFSASRMRIITKAGDQAEPFEEGTSFRLFAVEASEGSHDWMNTLLYDREGVEISGTVAYGDKVSYGVAPLNVIDFFGVTYGDGSSVDVSGNIGEEPVVQVAAGQDGTLPDLMYSDNLKAKTSSSGLLRMEFRHAMSKINFEILKQDESGDDDQKLTDARLKKVVLIGTSVSGTFNIDTGLWEDTSVQDRTVYEGSLPIGVEAQTFSTLLAMPSVGQVSLRVYLDGVEGGQEYVDHILKVADDKLLSLEQNHEYTFSIAVLKNDVRIVTVTPRVYEWIDVELGEGEAYFGQPVYFGGLMWMDRNLGAKSADCENDWYDTIGHYYQFGRNVPFVLDIQKWLAYTEDNGVKDLKEARIIRENLDRITRLHPQWNSYSEDKRRYISKRMVECVYSLDHKGDTVDGYKQMSKNDDILIRKPGDVILNADGEVDDEATSVGYRYGGNIQVWTLKDDNSAYYWKNVDDQPCPKGWRVPTRDDLYSFMPRGQQVNWNSSRYPVSLSNAASVYNTGRYGYVDSESGRYNVCYMIKNPGTDNAYRIMIKSAFAKNVGGEGYSKNKRYISITRFPATKDDKIEDFTSKTHAEALLPNSKENTLWNNPTETTDFPGCGYFVPDGNYPDLRSFGWGTIMRTSDPTGFDGGNVNNNSNWVQYLSVTDYQLSIQNGSRRVLGDQIRCVRDVNAK